MWEIYDRSWKLFSIWYVFQLNCRRQASARILRPGHGRTGHFYTVFFPPARVRSAGKQTVQTHTHTHNAEDILFSSGKRRVESAEIWRSAAAVMCSPRGRSTKAGVVESSRQTPGRDERERGLSRRSLIGAFVRDGCAKRHWCVLNCWKSGVVRRRVDAVNAESVLWKCVLMCNLYVDKY